MNTLTPPLLPPSTLYSEQARRDATRIKIYNSVLSQIYNKIRAIAKIPENERTLLYIVPEFIPGTPKIDVADCVVIVGTVVVFVFPPKETVIVAPLVLTLSVVILIPFVESVNV